MGVFSEQAKIVKLFEDQQAWSAQVLRSEVPDLLESLFEESSLSSLTCGTSRINCFLCMYVLIMCEFVPENGRHLAGCPFLNKSKFLSYPKSAYPLSQPNP